MGAPNTQPIFVLTPNRGRVRLTTGNTTRDLSSLTSASLLFSAGANSGSRIDTITFTHVANNSTQASIACVGRVYITSDAAGANPRLLKEIALPAVTPTVAAIGQAQTMTFSPAETLNTGEYLWVAISVTQTSGGYDIICNGGDF